MRLNMFFFCMQKTAYRRRISDWSSDVCSSDLSVGRRRALLVRRAKADDRPARDQRGPVVGERGVDRAADIGGIDRKSGVEGKRVSGRVDRGGRRIIIQQIYASLDNEH